MFLGMYVYACFTHEYAYLRHAYIGTIAPLRQSKHVPTSIWVRQVGSKGRRLTKVDITP